jgi:hypothetical protein
VRGTIYAAREFPASDAPWLTGTRDCCSDLSLSRLFISTRNELDRSNEDSDRYHLYRVFAFRKEPKLFRLPGPVDRSCQLDPAQ